jgi:5-enolpyruvylshikimate-3-phosphate synthase
LTEERIIRPAKNVMGSLRLPGDKSISHRYGMLAAFAEGVSRFTNFSTGADCASTLRCMEALGAKVRRLADGSNREYRRRQVVLSHPLEPCSIRRGFPRRRPCAAPPLPPAICGW